MPGSTDTIPLWRDLHESGVPFTLHAPHSTLGVNLADKSMLEINAKAYKEVALFAEALSPKYTVVHAGVNGSIDETIRQLKIIQPQNILIENKPYKTIYGEPICRGAVFEEVKTVIDAYGCGFCLDIGHAVCSANSIGIDPYIQLKHFQSLGPSCYHLSDNRWDEEIDRHMHLGQGNYDFGKICDIINLQNDIAIETAKDSKTNLMDFAADVLEIRKTVKAECQ